MTTFKGWWNLVLHWNLLFQVSFIFGRNFICSPTSLLLRTQKPLSLEEIPIQDLEVSADFDQTSEELLYLINNNLTQINEYVGFTVTVGFALIVVYIIMKPVFFLLSALFCFPCYASSALPANYSEALLKGYDNPDLPISDNYSD